MDEDRSPNVQLCAATYTAQWFGGEVLIVAAGFHPTSGHQVFFQRSPLTVFPPVFSLWHVAPSGPVLNVVTPFTSQVTFTAKEPVPTVVVNDAQGSHVVKVDVVPDSIKSHVSMMPAVGSAAIEEVAEPEAFPIDPNWKDREGYDENFLGKKFKVPLPVLSATQQQNTVEVPEEFRKKSNRYTLPYHHYSLAMNKQRRLAWFSAANIDGGKQRKLIRGKDRWSVDARIEEDPSAPKYQMGEELYAGADTDRGHLTRFLDVAWGSSDSEAKNSVADTFMFTNCSLQLSGFNQGKDRWQGLERFLLEEKARKEKRLMTVITGPVLRAEDPVYRNQHMNYSARIPLRFWKICALIRAVDEKLSATGFILGQQDITSLPGFEEAFDVSAAQITIAELERLTGLKFGTLKNYDHFAKTKVPGTLEAVATAPVRGRIKPLRSFEDIVI